MTIVPGETWPAIQYHSANLAVTLLLRGPVVFFVYVHPESLKGVTQLCTRETAALGVVRQVTFLDTLINVEMQARTCFLGLGMARHSTFGTGKLP